MKSTVNFLDAVLFYLAQTFRALGDHPAALAWYRRRISAGGRADEIWYSHYSIGLLHAEAGQTRASIRALREAIRLDPSRPEPFYQLARHLRERGRMLFATRCARRGLALPVSRYGKLFLEQDVLDWGLLQELSLAAFFTRFRPEGLAANERLALGAAVPGDVSAVAQASSILYARPLPDAVYHEIAPDLPEGLHPCNPSILRTREGYLVCCRCVSYRLDERQRYESTRPDGVLGTRNFLLRMDRSFRQTDQRELVWEEPPRRPSRVQGLEDARLVEVGGALAFTCTTADLHPDGPLRISLFSLDSGGRILRHVPLTGHGDGQTQKNWLPFSDPGTGELRAVYGYEPILVLGIDPATGRCAPVVERHQGRPFDRFRGSAGPVRLPESAGGGTLLLVHEVAFHGQRDYLHRFLEVESDWRVVRASRPFFFLHRGIEFASGACLDHDGETLLITLGVEDGEAWLCRVPLRTVRDLLEPLP